MNYRNRAMLDLAYEIDCQLQIPGVCKGGKGEPCHANWQEYGKAGAMKAHDNFHASGCRACHRELDQGRRFTEAEKQALWLAAYLRTWLLYVIRGLVVVASQQRKQVQTASVAPALGKIVSREPPPWRKP